MRLIGGRLGRLLVGAFLAAVPICRAQTTTGKITLPPAQRPAAQPKGLAGNWILISQGWASGKPFPALTAEDINTRHLTISGEGSGTVTTEIPLRFGQTTVEVRCKFIQRYNFNVTQTAGVTVLHGHNLPDIIAPASCGKYAGVAMDKGADFTSAIELKGDILSFISNGTDAGSVDLTIYTYKRINP